MSEARDERIEAWIDGTAAREAEQALIGATFRDNSLAVTLELEAEHFGEPLCGRLWGMARGIVQRGDTFTVGAIVKQAPDLAGFVRYCVDLGALGGWHKHTVDGYVAAVRDAYARRKIHGLASGLAEMIYDQDSSAEDLLAGFLQQTAGLASKDRSVSKRKLAERIVEDLRRPPVFYSTGLPSLDRVCAGGLWPGKTYGFGARKKVGKTVLLGTVSHALNHAAVPHLNILLEMSSEEIEQRNAAHELGINSIDFLTRRNEQLPQRMADYATSIPDHTIFIHKPGAALEEIFRMITRAVVDRGIKGVIIDYLQLIQGRQKGENEEQHLRNAAQAIADFCKTRGLWCIIAAQLNQDGNTRGGEGLKLACDLYFVLHREKDHEWAWLEMEESRYVPYRHVGEGDKDGKCLVPGLLLNPKGPYFQDASLVPADTPTPGGELF